MYYNRYSNLSRTVAQKMDNSGSKKEHVSRTYKGHDGYVPIVAYMGLEGWCSKVELRFGSQHSQEGFTSLMKRVLQKARTLTGKKLLVRLDSRHDSIENRVLLRKAKKVSYIIKWNSRWKVTSELHKRVFSTDTVTEPRSGKKVVLLTVRKRQKYEGETYVFSKMIKITECTINKHGQVLLLAENTVEGWWTNMDLAEEKIISLYKNHGLSEQFHSEIQTDLDLERLPSGKFTTNTAVMALSDYLQHPEFYRRARAAWRKVSGAAPWKMRRLKTVLQEMMCLAARLIASWSRLRLRFSGYCATFEAFTSVHGRLSAGVKTRSHLN